MDFTVGDRVQVVANDPNDPNADGRYIGAQGTIEEIDPDPSNVLPIVVFLDNYQQYSYTPRLSFCEAELQKL